MIVEPFAGSAGYSTRYADRSVVLCDLDPVIVGVWKYLISASQQQILELPDIGPTETVDTHKLEGPERDLVGFWLNKAASSPRVSPSRWMRDGTHAASFWGSAIRERIARQLPAIRHWEVHHASYEQCPHTGVATWFIDPPYIGAGGHYRFGPSKIDYGHLAEWTMERCGQVIACEGAAAEWLPFTELGHLKTARQQPALERVFLGGIAGHIRRIEEAKG